MTYHFHEKKVCQKEEIDVMMSNPVEGCVCGSAGIKNSLSLKYR